MNWLCCGTCVIAPLGGGWDSLMSLAGKVVSALEVPGP